VTWDAITKAKWSTVKAWREAALLLDARGSSVDAVARFLTQGTPPSRLVEVLEGLVLEGLLSRQVVTQVEERIFQRIRPDGLWM
jgi:hypothetical protein